MRFVVQFGSVPFTLFISVTFSQEWHGSSPVGERSVADSNSMAPARWVNGEWQKVAISKSYYPSEARLAVRNESGPPPPAAYRQHPGPTPEETRPLSGPEKVHPQLEDPGPNASLTDWTRYVRACSERLREHPPDDFPPRTMEKFSLNFIGAVSIAGFVLCNWRQAGRRLVNCKHSGSAKSIVLHGQWFRWKVAWFVLKAVAELEASLRARAEAETCDPAGSLSWVWHSLGYVVRQQKGHLS